MHVISTPNAPAPAGHYSQAVVHNGLVYVAGQLPKLQGGFAGMPAITTEPGAHHYRLLFLELVNTYRDNQIVEIGSRDGNLKGL